MELLQLKQKQVTDAGLSLAPPSSFSASGFDLFATRMPPAIASGSTSNEISSASSSVEELDDSVQMKKRKRLEGGDRDRDRRSPGEQGTQIVAGLMQDVDLRHSTTPLPPGWEQCLDLQSGEMFYYNPALRIRTRQDPRKGFTPNDWIAAKNTKNAATASLLQTNSYSKKLQEEQLQQQQQQRQAAVESLDLSLNLSSSSLSSSPPPSTAILKQQPSRIAREQSLRDFDLSSKVGSSSGGQQVMAACRLCLRFVMLPKSSRVCPYCGSFVL